MKQVHFLIMFIIVVFAHCKGPQRNAEDFLAGTYVREIPNVSGKIYDTVIIREVNATAHQFEVEQRIVLHRASGKPSFKDRQREQYAAYFNVEKQVLEIPEVMGYVSFKDDRMVFNGAEYQKK